MRHNKYYLRHINAIMCGAIIKSRHKNRIMPKKVSRTELDAIFQIVAGFPDGASVTEISGALKASLPRRTLQRHLAQLVAQNRLIIEGRGRGSRYRLPPEKTKVRAPIDPVTATVSLNGGLTGSLQAQAEIYIGISSEGEIIKQSVRGPIQKRHPVGYNRAFLDEYRPNNTFYLSPKIRRHLVESGRSLEADRPAGVYAQQIFDRLLIDLSWNSSRLEGNTYSLLETERLLQLGEATEGKDALEAQMILNHKAAIGLLVEQAGEVDFNRYTILNLHALLSENLLADPRACGRLRTIAVGIGGTVYRPLEVPQLIDECFQQVLDTAAVILDPFEQAFFTMVHLPYLQPFEDINKRVSRLAANLPLIRLNLCPLSFVDVPRQAYIDGLLGIYELNRIELLRDVFIWAYERSCVRYSAVRQSLGKPDAFRLHYRVSIAETVTEIVYGGMDKKTAAAFIQRRAAKDISSPNQARFIEVTETEIMSLHEGNIARYRLRPSQYRKWQETWH